ncbi:hypothetical protein PORCRE_1765 [Porphyromonas crevioricanis JCM 15906]|uniref:Uncharacterized protein n=1 Tax=Porphyromonas crevioricanis JCM 15906 TaxID=1305617 RepID=T1DT68_9PORP|nr:hypothetical protein PORCRE_1765 [Porphyromonas crevioricanis JCM 15906]
MELLFFCRCLRGLLPGKTGSGVLFCEERVTKCRWQGLQNGSFFAFELELLSSLICVV